MMEKQLEQKLVKAVKVWGLALKLVSPGFAGMPDRRAANRWENCFYRSKGAR